MSLFHRRKSIIGAQDRWQNFSESGPFWYLMTLSGITTFLYSKLTCLKNWQKLKNSKNGQKTTNFYASNGFCSHLHNFHRFCMKLRIPVVNGLDFICYLITRRLKFFYNNLFLHRSDFFIFVRIFVLFTSARKKIIVKNVMDVGS